MRPWAVVKYVERRLLEEDSCDEPPELSICALVLFNAAEVRKVGPANGGVNPLVVESGVRFRFWPGLC